MDMHICMLLGRKTYPCKLNVRLGREVVGANGYASLPSVGVVQGCLNVANDLIQNGERVSYPE